eukprot:2181326-Amphidinium_carterae.2
MEFLISVLVQPTVVPKRDQGVSTDIRQSFCKYYMCYGSFWGEEGWEFTAKEGTARSVVAPANEAVDGNFASLLSATAALDYLGERRIQPSPLVCKSFPYP